MRFPIEWKCHFPTCSNSNILGHAIQLNWLLFVKIFSDPHMEMQLKKKHIWKNIFECLSECLGEFYLQVYPTKTISADRTKHLFFFYKFLPNIQSMILSQWTRNLSEVEALLLTNSFSVFSVIISFSKCPLLAVFILCLTWMNPWLNCIHSEL